MPRCEFCETWLETDQRFLCADCAPADWDGKCCDCGKDLKHDDFAQWADEGSSGNPYCLPCLAAECARIRRDIEDGKGAAG